MNERSDVTWLTVDDLTGTPRQDWREKEISPWWAGIPFGLYLLLPLWMHLCAGT